MKISNTEMFNRVLIISFLSLSIVLIAFIMRHRINERPKMVSSQLNAPLIITDKNLKPDEPSYFFVDLKDRKTKKVFKVKILLLPEGRVSWENLGYVEETKTKKYNK